MKKMIAAAALALTLVAAPAHAQNAAVSTKVTINEMVFDLEHDEFRNRTVWSREWENIGKSPVRGIWTYRVKNGDAWGTVRMAITYRSNNRGSPIVYLRGGVVAETRFVDVDVDCQSYGCSYDYVVEIEITDAMVNDPDFAIKVNETLVPIGASKTLAALAALDDVVAP